MNATYAGSAMSQAAARPQGLVRALHGVAFVLGVASMSATGCGDSRSSAPAQREPAAVPRPPLAPGWRVDVPFASIDAVELTDGTIIAVATVPEEGGPHAVGKVAVRSRGFDDLVAITITPSGEITHVRAIGGPGLESRMALAAAGDHAVLLLGTTGPIDDGQLQLAGLARPFDHPGYLLVDLDPTKGPVRATTVFDAGQVRLPHLAALAGGDLALVAQVRAPSGSEAEPSSVVQRRGPDGALRWERRLSTTLWRVMPPPTDAAAFAVLASVDDETDVIALGNDGAELGRLALREVDPIGGSGLGVDVLVRSGRGAMVYGAAGSNIGIGDGVVKRRRVPSQPFVVRWPGTAPGDVVDLFDGVGHVLCGDATQAILTVVHPPRGATEPLRGTYLVRAPADPAHRQLVPIVTRRSVDGDDGPDVAVTGPLIYPFDATFLADGALLLEAHGDRVAGSGVLLRYVLPEP